MFFAIAIVESRARRPRRSSCRGVIRLSSAARFWTESQRGGPVAEVAQQLGVSGQTIYNWRRQDLVDRGLRPGVTTGESAELVAARRRIRELECELVTAISEIPQS